MCNNHLDIIWLKLCSKKWYLLVICIFFVKLLLMCEICRKQNVQLEMCLECHTSICSRHWWKCQDPTCTPYIICPKCQRQPNYSLWRTLEPENMWVCQTCAVQADHSDDFRCKLCGQHYNFLHTCKTCGRKVCRRDNFWCSYKKCSHQQCRKCNNSLKDIVQINGKWICKKCRGSDQHHKKDRESENNRQQERKRVKCK